MLENSYTAFISYRHTMPDEAVAKRLHTLIETYSVPSKVRASSGRRRMGRVFRDQEELPLSVDLGADIRTALDCSEWLIVLCSPRYLESMWCKAELDYFISLGRRDRILAVLVEGEPEEAFPEQLRYITVDGERTEIEPLAADVRASSVSASLKKLKNEKLRVLAPMLGVSYDTLRQRAKRRRARLTAGVTAAGFIAMAGFLTYALVKNTQIAEQRDLAVNNQMQLLIEEANVSTDSGNKLSALKKLNRAAAIRATVGEGNDPQLRSALEYSLYDSPFETVLTIDNDNRRFTSMVFSHDDRYLLGVTNLNSACLIDATEGKLLYTVSRSDFGQLDCVGFTTDDRYFYMVDAWNGYISLYHVESGELFRQYDADSEITWQIGEKVFPMSGDRMLIVKPTSLLIWNYADDTGEEILKLNEENPLIGYTQPLIIALSPDEQSVAVGSHGYGSGMEIVRLSDLSETPLERDDRGYMAVAYSGDGRYISAISGQQFCLWEAQSGRQLLCQELDQTNGSLTGAVVNYDGTVMLVMSTDYLGAVDVGSGKLLWEQKTASNVVTEAAISPDGKYVCATGGITGVFDLATGEKLCDRGGTLFSADSSKLLCDTYTAAPQLLVTDEASTQKRVDSFTEPLYEAARYTDPAGNIMLPVRHPVGDFYTTGAGSVNRQARVYNSPDLRYAAYTHQDGFIEVFDITDPDNVTEIYCVAEHCYNSVTDLTFNGSLMASCGGYDPRCVIFDLESGRILHVLPAEEYVFGCEFSADGSKIILLCGKERNRALVYSTVTGNLLYRFTAPEGKTFDVIGFNEAGSLVAAVTEDGTAITGELYPSLDELINEAEQR